MFLQISCYCPFLGSWGPSLTSDFARTSFWPLVFFSWPRHLIVLLLFDRGLRLPHGHKKPGLNTASWWGHLRISCSTFFPTWGGGELGGIVKGGYSVDGEAKIWRRMRYKYPLNHQFTVPTIIRCCTNLSGRGFFHCLHFRVKKLFRNLFAESALSHSGSPAAARFLICSFLEHFQSFWGKFWGGKSEI